MASPIVFSKHAEDMLAERYIERAWVNDAIHNPEIVEKDPDRPNVKRAFKRIPARGNRVLRVAYVEAENRIRVVTLFFDRARRS